jgi:uncharacterized membrane protein
MFMETLGWTGAVLGLIAYALVSVKWLEPHTRRYQSLNILASFLSAIYASSQDAYAYVAVSVIWLLIAVCTYLHLVIFAIATRHANRIYKQTLAKGHDVYDVGPS